VFRVSDDEGNLKHAFSQAKFYYLSDINKRELVLNALGELIVSYLIVYRSKNEFSAPVERIRTLILRNCTSPDFALDEAVRDMPFHYDYLRKLFKKEMGITPLEYMTKLRMKKAEQLLSAMRNKEYSVAEVAQMCGYEDALYFSRVFKKTYGCSPSNFNKKTDTP
jgi:AraC-like DNA-binding protein